ncbi:MAG TPA: YCF48-related protein [Candidatus Krumholzibacteria bacterium]|nr:YCF48-related protein [Candidatus Krumholzibacteria bacterium]
MKHLSGRPAALPALVVLLLLPGSPAHAGWQWLHPTPQGHTLRDVEFLTTTTAIAAGDAGTIMVSHDAGVTWTARTKVNGVATRLNKVAALDGSTAIVVGDSGVILKTTDAGATWEQRPSGTTMNLVDVDFLGSSGMAVAPALILRSTNGGDIWTPHGPLLGYLSGVAMLSSTTAIALDDISIWRTSDGGATWSSTFIQDDPRHISFHLGTFGVITGSFDLLYVTSDAGVTWQTRNIAPMYTETYRAVNDIEIVAPDEIVMAATLTGCNVYTGTCTSFGEAIASTDGATTLDVESGPRVFHGVALSTAGTRLFVGDGGVICRWAPPADFARVTGPDLEPTDAAAIAFAGNATGVAISNRFEYYSYDDYSLILHTADAGVTWNRTWYGGALLADVAFAPSGAPTPVLYSVGDEVDPTTHSVHGLLIKSQDGGANWTKVWADTDVPGLNAIAFASPTRAVAVGDGGAAAVIDNEVVTTANPVATSLHGVAFASANTGVAVGRYGVVLRTIDGGAGWSPVTSGTSQWLVDIAFADANVGVAVGNAGTVLRSDDAGASWSPVAVPTTGNIMAIAFTSTMHAFITQLDGAVFETSDAGMTWSALDSPTSHSLIDIAPSGAHGAYFIGHGPIVVRYQQLPVPTMITSFNAVASSFAVSIAWDVHDASDLDHFRIARADADHTVREYVATPDRRVFRDDDVSPGATYEYRMFAVDRSGDEFASAPARVTIPAADVALLPNVPNPFNPSTTLRFVVPARERVTLAIYDIAGRHVATLLDAVREPGLNTVEWNGTDRSGNPVASGVYLSRLRVGTKSASRTMVLLK